MLPVAWRRASITRLLGRENMRKWWRKGNHGQSTVNVIGKKWEKKNIEKNLKCCRIILAKTRNHHSAPQNLRRPSPPVAGVAPHWGPWELDALEPLRLHIIRNPQKMHPLTRKNPLSHDLHKCTSAISNQYHTYTSKGIRCFRTCPYISVAWSMHFKPRFHGSSSPAHLPSSFLPAWSLSWHSLSCWTAHLSKLPAAPLCANWQLNTVVWCPPPLNLWLWSTLERHPQTLTLLRERQFPPWITGRNRANQLEVEKQTCCWIFLLAAD